MQPSKIFSLAHFSKLVQFLNSLHPYKISKIKLAPTYTTEPLDKLLAKYFPSLEPALIRRLAEISTIAELPAGTELVQSGKYVRSVMLVVEGHIKLYREGEDGGEYFIYYLQPGGACALSMVCAGKQSRMDIKGIAVEKSVVVKVPVGEMDELVRQYISWYHFVVETYRSRFEDLLLTLDDVAFKNMDERLLSYLGQQRHVFGTDLLPLTHQQIATDLNSSREVISRLLKKLEVAGLVKLSRNHIEWLDVVSQAK